MPPIQARVRTVTMPKVPIANSPTTMTAANRPHRGDRDGAGLLVGRGSGETTCADGRWPLRVGGADDVALDPRNLPSGERRDTRSATVNSVPVSSLRASLTPAVTSCSSTKEALVGNAVSCRPRGWVGLPLLDAVADRGMTGVVRGVGKGSGAGYEGAAAAERGAAATGIVSKKRLHLWISKIVFEGRLLIGEIPEVAKHFFPQPALSI